MPQYNLPADLPTNWALQQKVAPEGSDVLLPQQYGYNYLGKQVNDAQTAVNELGMIADTTSNDVTEVSEDVKALQNMLNGGETGQILVKDSNEDYEASWININSEPLSNTTIFIGNNSTSNGNGLTQSNPAKYNNLQFILNKLVAAQTKQISLTEDLSDTPSLYIGNNNSLIVRLVTNGFNPGEVIVVGSNIQFSNDLDTLNSFLFYNSYAIITNLKTVGNTISQMYNCYSTINSIDCSSNTAVYPLQLWGCNIDFGRNSVINLGGKIISCHLSNINIWGGSSFDGILINATNFKDFFSFDKTCCIYVDGMPVVYPGSE